MPFDPNPDQRWYAVHTQAGCEDSAATTLRERAAALGLDDNLFAVVGPPVTAAPQLLTGSLAVRMAMNDETYSLVTTTPNVMGFMGNPNPRPLPDTEAQGLIAIIKRGALAPPYEPRQNVHVVNGPFAGFDGVIEEVDLERAMLRVTVSIFGRPTPLMLEFGAVEKIV